MSTYVKTEKLYGPSTKIVSKQSNVGVHIKIQHQQRLTTNTFSNNWYPQARPANLNEITFYTKVDHKLVPFIKYL